MSGSGSSALRESEERYAAVFESAPFAIALTRLSDGIIVSVNDAFLRLFEFNREEIVGNTSVSLQIADAASYARVAEELRAQGRVRDFEVRRRTKSGVTRVLSINVDPTTIGGQPFTLTTIQDITARAEADERLRAALQSRDDFIAIASHELKTPLTAIRLQMELLERRASLPNAAELGTKALKVARISIRQVDRLNRLVDDMLDIPRVSAGNLALERAPLDLAIVVRASLDGLADSLHAAGCDVTVHIEPGVVASVDRFRLEQAVTNILANVIKYAPGKPCEVRVERRGGEAIIEVHDRGMGITRGLESRIFERFFRAVSHTHVSGFGLGLYIADQIVRAHGGRIDVKNEVGQGATFTVVLPARGGERAA